LEREVRAIVKKIENENNISGRERGSDFFLENENRHGN
jgi:hypothetical protein